MQFFFCEKNRIFKFYNERRRYKNEFSSNKHYSKVIWIKIFYWRFIHRYLQITIFWSICYAICKLTLNCFFIFTNKTTTTFRRLKDVFQSAFILIHFDSKLFFRLKIDVFDHDVIDIIFQLQTNNQWHSVVFYLRKIIFVEGNYETHDQKLLTIVMCFKHWKLYLKNSFHSIEILIDHKNLKKFMNVQILSDRQIKWTMKIIVFDFVIKHRVKKFNSDDAFFERSDYQSVNTKITKLLSIFQKKLSMINSLSVSVISRIRTLCVVVSRNFYFNNASFETEFLKNLNNKTFKSILLFMKRFENRDTFRVNVRALEFRCNFHYIDLICTRVIYIDRIWKSRVRFSFVKKLKRLVFLCSKNF